MSNKIIIPCLILAGVLVGGCGDTTPETVLESDVTPIILQTETVQLSQVPVTITVVGTTEPFTRAMPGTRLSGHIKEVLVAEGDDIKEGAVLARIESQDLLARRDRATSGVQAARTALTNAENTIKRMRNLYNEKAIAKQKLDDAETGFARAQAGLADAEGAIREVEAHLQYSVVTAPFSGVITRKFVQPGDMASPGMPLFTIEQQHPIKVTVEVNERDLIYVETGMTVMMDMEGTRSGIVSPAFEGLVEAIVPAADPMSRTFRVKIRVSNPEGLIRSGVFVRVGFPKEDRTALLIPVKAVVERGQLQGVFEIFNDSAHLRWVRLGKTFGDHIEVISGLDQGIMIAVSEVDRLIDGHPVEVSNRE